ncbi:hypothetical protein WJX73_002551 [Symbiochloris irregularis]|uniref:PsbP C-terminal domain-containing protein n=1 Tax=Symbiochloris irregularis TaxID=706552 RepID=A0AAW1Q2G4_9CHLO
MYDWRLERERAAQTVPSGYRQYVDKLDGYSFNIPGDWAAVTSSGNDVFFRNIFNVNENVFVGLSSPSSKKYDSLSVLGDPDKAAKQILKQCLDELGTTRLGVKREGEVVTASRRTGPDGREYYDVQLRVKSFASRNQLAVYQRKLDSGLQLEWDRRYITTLGVANNQLYQLRLQTATKQYDKSEGMLLDIAHSFQCTEVEK